MVFVIFEVISISLFTLDRETVHEMSSGVVVTVNFEGVFEGRAEAKVHSSSAGACAAGAIGGGAVKLSRRFVEAAGCGAVCDDWN